MEVLRRYKEKMDIPYEILWAGSSKKSEAIKSLPMLNEIVSFPTMIFLDADNNIKRIHTGFSGPATSEFDAFVQDFEQFVLDL